MKSILLSAILAVALAAAIQCPIHGNTNPYFTGKTTSVDGVLLKEMHCYRGPHTFWVRW